MSPRTCRSGGFALLTDWFSDGDIDWLLDCCWLVGWLIHWCSFQSEQLIDTSIHWCSRKRTRRNGARLSVQPAGRYGTRSWCRSSPCCLAIFWWFAAPSQSRGLKIGHQAHHRLHNRNRNFSTSGNVFFFTFSKWFYVLVAYPRRAKNTDGTMNSINSFKKLHHRDDVIFSLKFMCHDFQSRKIVVQQTKCASTTCKVS